MTVPEVSTLDRLHAVVDKVGVQREAGLITEPEMCRLVASVAAGMFVDAMAVEEAGLCLADGDVLSAVVDQWAKEAGA